jgi:hypothetical protein
MILLFLVGHPSLELLSSSSNLLAGHYGHCEKLSRYIRDKELDRYLICVPSMCFANAVVMTAQCVYVYIGICMYV